MKKHIVLSGYYGFRNAGDDAVCYAIIQHLRREIPDASICVLSNDPNLTTQTYGVRAVSRWQPTKVIPELVFADLLISGGGSLLQDVTSKNGILYYLSILEVAKRLRTPHMIYAQGIGPLKETRNQRLVARAMNNADLITVRDPASRRLLKNIGTRRPIFVAPDPVLGLDASDVSAEDGRKRLRHAGWLGEKPLILCAPRPWADVDRVPLYAAALDRLADDGYDVALLAMQPQAEGALCHAISGHMEHRAVVIAESLNTRELLSLFKVSKLVIAMRLHALIMGAVCGTRLLGLSYDPKVDALMRLLQKESHLLGLRRLDADILYDHACAALADEPVEQKRIELLGGFAKLPAKFAKCLLS